MVSRGVSLQELHEQARWASFHIGRLEEIISGQQRAIETLEARLRQFEHEALDAASDLYFRLDALSAVVNQLVLRTRALQTQLAFLGGRAENTDPSDFSLHSLD